MATYDASPLADDLAPSPYPPNFQDLPRAEQDAHFAREARKYDEPKRLHAATPKVPEQKSSQEGASDPRYQPPGEPADLATGRFKLIPWRDIAFDQHEEWLVKRILPRSGVAAIYGRSGAFKSFVAMHVALCVALGEDWAGRRVQQGAAVYIAAEGARGLRKRKKGYVATCGLADDVPFYLIERAPNFGRLDGDAAALIADIEAAGVRPALIVIDTAAQTLQGADENGEGMSALIANAQGLALRFGCLVALVHHVGHGEDAQKRLRGHSGLPAALDAIVLCERQAGDLVATLTLQKSKDELSGVGFAATLARVVVGHDADGDEISTLIVTDVVDAGTAATPANRRAPAKSRKLLIEVIEESIAEAGEDFHISDGSTVRAVPESIVRSRYYARLAEKPFPNDTPEKRAERQCKAFGRAINAALDSKEIADGFRNEERLLWRL